MDILLKKLKEKIIQANLAYRTGNAILTDAEYDALLEELEQLTNGEDPLLQKIGFEVAPNDDRKEVLPIPMYSMNKLKSIEELKKWGELNFIPNNTEMIITPKYDGLSLCVNEHSKQAWTRGNGIEGQKSDAHFQMLMKNKTPILKKVSGYTFGEMIMKRSMFQKKWQKEFKNSRNMGAGAMNSKEAKPMLQDFDYLRFGIYQNSHQEWNKKDQLDFLNQYVNSVSIPYKICPLSEIDETILNQCYQNYEQEYEIDGLIIEVNQESLRKQLGREKNGNPVYARAWKGFQTKGKQSTIQKITFQISKYGLLKPVAHIEPIELDGVTISNVTLVNAKYIQENQIGNGAEVVLIRSGQVIPKIISVIQKATVQLPITCPSCHYPVKWNLNKIELYCPNRDGCEEQKIQKIIAFFTILEVEHLAEGIIRQFYNAGYDTVHKILNMTPDQMEALEHFKQRKSEVIYNSIQSKLKQIPLEKLRHASSIFEGLGSKKLKLLNHFHNPKIQPTMDQIIKIDGFSEKTAQIFIQNYLQFYDFIQPLPITFEIKEEPTQTSNTLQHLNVCFSGIRRKDLEEMIESNSGKVSKSISNKTTHLVMKQKNSGSAKEKKATQLGISILEIEEFETWILDKLKG